MGKTGKWFKSFLTGKRDKPKEKCDNISSSNSSTPVPKEKRRWSFRRPTETRKEHDQSLASTSAHGFLESRIDPERHAVAVAVATAAAADAAVAAAQAAAAMVRLTSGPTGKSGGNGRIPRRNSVIEEVAAIKIQSVFRSYLARKALCALKGLVKLQALVRGRLVRKQASATLRCMQALVAVQTRARLQRIKILEEEERSQCRTPQRQRSVRNSPQHPRFRQSNDNSTEENVKIVEVDTSMPKARHSYSPAGSHPERPLSSHSRGGAYHTSNHPKISPTASALTDMSPRTYSGRFDEFSFTTAQSGGCSPAFGNYFKSGSCASDATKSPYAGTSQDYPLFPNYMANTESSRAKARSQSAPKSRPADSFERSTSTSRRRVSLEGRNIPRGIKMQRSASQAGPTVSGFQYQYQYPWSVKLDKSSISLKDSECGSTSTVMTNASYYSTLLAQEVHGIR
ncbi:protein IQ-DOMAIN 19-like isoform X2 [Carex rostrata]